ncbi:acyl-CoA thioesterase [Legionella sp. CNM-4043-24]|uniref:acyl-CoA thioesterase n=1 Tax=Legionella sp. CNM-4043-24 TaxID=3421646 RepID=UPI00403A7D28
MTEKSYIHQKTFDIAWGDMDALGHVNNARYLDYFQEARINWLANVGIVMTEEIGPVVIHVACTYLKPVVYPATLTIKSWCSAIGNSSFSIEHDLFQGEQMMAQGVSKIVWVNYKKGQSVPFPQGLRDVLTA